MWVLRSPGAPFAVGPGGSWVGSEGFGRGRLWGGAEPAVVGAMPAHRVRRSGSGIRVCEATRLAVGCMHMVRSSDQVQGQYKTCGGWHADGEEFWSGSYSAAAEQVPQSEPV